MTVMTMIMTDAGMGADRTKYASGALLHVDSSVNMLICHDSALFRMSLVSSDSGWRTVLGCDDGAGGKNSRMTGVPDPIIPDMTDQMQPERHTITARTLLRRNVDAAIRAATMPVHVVECDLEEVDLSGLDLTNFSFERCTIIKADLSHVKAAGTTWTGCRARQAVVKGAEFTDAAFKGGDWNNSDWERATIAGATFTGVKLTGSSFVSAKSLGAGFEDCPMRSADLRGLSFKKGRLGQCDMTSANLSGTDFRDAVFGVGSSIAGAALTDARFTGADLRNADLSGHGPSSLEVLKGARISAAQAVQIIRNSGMVVS